VIHFLPCFGEWLIACWLLPFLPFLCLFTDSSVLRPTPCPSPFLWCCPLCCCARLQFTLCYLVLLSGVSVHRGCTALCFQG
jgi:hypothetical protein